MAAPDLSEAPYPQVFSQHMDPRKIAAACLLEGRAVADPSAPFRYVDFGCGVGFTLLLLAQAFPWASFLGIDHNAAHIQRAQRDAETLRLTNLSFRHASFADLTPTDLGGIDFAVANGIHSWVDDAARADLWQAVQAALAPDGVFQLGYNTSAGWAQLAPYQALIADAIELGLPAEQAIQSILVQFSRHTAQDRPVLSQRLAALSQHDPDYLLHEFAANSWRPTSVSALSAEAATYGLTYVAPYYSPQSAQPEDQRLLPIENRQFWEDYYNTRAQRGYRWAFFQRAAQTENSTKPLDPGALQIRTMLGGHISERAFLKGWLQRGAAHHQSEAARLIDSKRSLFLHTEHQPEATCADALHVQLDYLAQATPARPVLVLPQTGLLLPCPVALQQQIKRMLSTDTAMTDDAIIAVFNQSSP
ncbi:methyltransferase domain-containing protein [Shimia sp. R10_1]|uniref:class I SAM-dependent methyltransferase n=1 Tax=Shimia sp. R10_1 TaxID=2821095 RepID=UPI001ADA13F9|nr:class I SAM-dependent methyltransferase [Shimia sp. R10_1]MBO9474762.1 methyltransferase domain-containing protein [Shimia sp. R10_1]